MTVSEGIRTEAIRASASPEESGKARHEQPIPAPRALTQPAGLETAQPNEVKSTPVARPGWSSFVLLALAAAALVVGGVYLYLLDFYGVETDDANVDAHIISVVPKVAAYVSALHVDDNSQVASGEVLVELDQRDFLVAVDAAVADKANAEASAANIEAQLSEQQSLIVQNESAVSGDRATSGFAQQQLQRYADLANKGSGTVQRWQQAQADSDQQQAGIQRDLAALAAARAHIAVLETQGREVQATIDRQQAALAQAHLNLSYTKIYAVEAGTVANKRVVVGDYVQPGQVLFSIVPYTIHVTANYKETQLTDVRPGQPVTIWVDAFPGLRIRGHVDSIQRGTGSQFALLPPENATGNFVKVVQRVPVKIIFDDPAAALQWISPGMSVETRISLSQPPWWLKWLLG
jgi:membrane fusion protein (multidrug efflux system)